MAHLELPQRAHGEPRHDRGQDLVRATTERPERVAADGWPVPRGVTGAGSRIPRRARRRLSLDMDHVTHRSHLLVERQPLLYRPGILRRMRPQGGLAGWR